MSRRKGEITPTAIDRGWRHQIALPDDMCVKENFTLLRAWLAENAPGSQTRKVNAHYPDGYHVEVMRLHCFATKDEAEAFRARFGGLPFDPAWRGRSASGEKWHRAEPWRLWRESGPLSVPGSLRR